MKGATLLFPMRFIFLMWVAFSIDFYFGVDLGFLGILPRELPGLLGIVTAPLVHGSLNHILSNSVPLLILGGVMFYFFPEIATRVFLQCYFFTNILVWILARGEIYHIGASGVVFGLAMFLISFGLFRKNVISILISVIATYFYWRTIASLLTFDPRISWESHLFGAVSGLVSAYLLRNYRRGEEA